MSRKAMKGGRARRPTAGGRRAGSSNNGKATITTGEIKGMGGKSGGEDKECGLAKKQKGGASSSSIMTATGTPNFSGHKLCGFVQAVLIARRRGTGGGADDDDHGDNREDRERGEGKEEEEVVVVPIGSACHLAGQGGETVVEVGNNTGVVLISIPPPPAVTKPGPVSNAEGEGPEDGQREAPRNDWMMLDEIGKMANRNGNNAVSDTPDRNSLDSCVMSELMECTPVAERVASGNLCVDSAGGSTGGEKSRGGRRGRGSGSPGSAAAKRVYNRSGGSGSRVCSILQQLQLLEQRNNAIVTGRIVRISRTGGKAVRYVALLDVYLPSSLWSSARNFWRNGSLVAIALSHLSCDWKLRESMLTKIDSNEPSSGGEDTSLWDIGDCLVYGCKLHRHQTEETNSFDLHSLFKSLPSYDRDEKPLSTIITPNSAVSPSQVGIWHMPDDILTSILGRLVPKDLHHVAAVCRHFRTLAVSVMPCMNLKLFPHQQAAVRWMLQRELTPQVLPHPYIREMETVDGFYFYLDCVTGDFTSEAPSPVTDFRGGLFCDEPGLGKTVTALSLILKTQGTLSQPPPGVHVRWCEHNSDQKYGYYEISTHAVPHGLFGMSALKRCSTLKARRYQFDSTDLPGIDSYSPARKRYRGSIPGGSNGSSSSTPYRMSGPAVPVCTPIRTSFRVKRKLWDAYGDGEENGSASKVLKDGRQAPGISTFSKEIGRVERGSSKPCSTSYPIVDKFASLYGSSLSSMQRDRGKQEAQELKNTTEPDEIWVQCDACSKWRKLPDEAEKPKDGLAWFCSMNKDPSYQECSVPEETFDTNETITSLPGFTRNGKASEQALNVAFFRNVLKEHAQFLDVEAKRAVAWLADLSHEKLAKVAVGGFTMPPGLRLASVSGHDQHQYDRLFKAFGLVKQKEAKKVTRWWYPRGLSNLSFDSKALKAALSDPVDDVTRFYLSKATLVVVPQYLIEHWRTQIKKHTAPGQLRVFIWNDIKKPPAAHSLAWDYDIVITTFSRLSVEWSSRDSSALVRIHWLRIVLDEGHTLGASLSLTNKLQMAISMQASRRWLLTGTPTPNTPSSQVAHLQPMLKFLHEEVYGNNQKMWEGAVLRPFESGREEGRERLINLLHRCMISARKSDLHSIPPCIRKVKLLDFTEQHAASYNELVVTVKRNILMADWKDPSHVESLLNPKQWKFRSSTIRNVRLSCCVAGHMKFRNAGEDIQETMDMFMEQGMDPRSEEFITIKSSLIHGGACQRCREWCRLPIVTPCRHLLCLSCVSLDCEKCTIGGCENKYKMQNPEDRARPENPNPKWPVPQDLIELQPSYVQENWDPDWHATSSSKVAYLIGQLKELYARNEKKIKQLCTVDILGDQEFLQPCKGMSNESMWEPQDLVQMTQNTQPEKAIVFSQFLEHINVVEQQLTSAGLRFVGMYSPMPSTNKMKSLMTFQKDPECTVLVMDGSAALGLDLSFVTNVYLMEPIWDRSMEEQVVSRAHRMGATRSVLVETLAMHGTIEEQMLEFLKAPVNLNRGDKDVHDMGERSKPIHKSMHDPAESSYLAHLEFVRTQNSR
ncbi:unnamed protein product [Calypogeia fissa]